MGKVRNIAIERILPPDHAPHLACAKCISSRATRLVPLPERNDILYRRIQSPLIPMNSGKRRSRVAPRPATPYATHTRQQVRRNRKRGCFFRPLRAASYQRASANRRAYLCPFCRVIKRCCIIAKTRFLACCDCSSAVKGEGEGEGVVIQR